MVSDNIPVHKIEVRVKISRQEDGREIVIAHEANNFTALCCDEFNKVYTDEYKADAVVRLAKGIAKKIGGDKWNK